MTGPPRCGGPVGVAPDWSGVEDLTRQSEAIGREGEPGPLPATLPGQQAGSDEHLEVVTHRGLGQAEGLR